MGKKGKNYNIEGKGINLSNKIKNELYEYYDEEIGKCKRQQKIDIKNKNNDNNKSKNNYNVLNDLIRIRLNDDKVEIENKNSKKLINIKTNIIYDEIYYQLELSIGKYKLNSLKHISLQNIVKYLNNYDIDELNKFFDSHILSSLPIKSLLLYWGCKFHTINDNNLHLISSINDHDKLQFLIFNEDISSNGINQFFNQAIDNIVTLTNMEDWLLLCEENFLIVYDYLPIKSLSLLSSSIDINTFKNITSYIKNITEIRLHNVFNQSRINNNKKNLDDDNFNDNKKLVPKFNNDWDMILTIISKNYKKLERLHITYCNLTSSSLLTFYSQILTNGSFKLNNVVIEGCDIEANDINNLQRLYFEIGITLNIIK